MFTLCSHSAAAGWELVVRPRLKLFATRAGPAMALLVLPAILAVIWWYDRSDARRRRRGALKNDMAPKASSVPGI